MQTINGWNEQTVCIMTNSDSTGNARKVGDCMAERGNADVNKPSITLTTINAPVYSLDQKPRPSQRAVGQMSGLPAFQPTRLLQGRGVTVRS